MQNELTDDVKLRLLAGEPIYISNNIPVHPVTLSEIAKIGENIFLRCLNELLVSDMDVQKITNNDDITAFKHLYNKFVYGTPIDKLVVNSAFRLFLKNDVDYIENEFIVGDLDINNQCRLNEDNFKELVQVIKWQCCIKDTKSQVKDEFYTTDPKVQKAIERLKKHREARERAKKKYQKDVGEPLALSDLVDILSTFGNGLNILNIWNLTLYQFNKQFNRTRLRDKYRLDIKAMLAGAKIDNPENWMQKIE